MSFSSGGALVHPDALEGVVQIVELHRLADVLVEAGLQRALPVFAPRVGGHGDGAHVPAFAAGRPRIARISV